MSLLRHAFGHDIFISYARRDASAYALELHRALTARGFTCFLDRPAFKAGSRFKERLTQEVRRSAVLVLVCSPAALTSALVAFEVRVFAATRREMLVIRLPDAATPFPWPEVEQGDPAWIPEDAEALERGTPADRTVLEIEKHFNVTKQHAKRIRLLSAVALTLFGLLLLSIYYGSQFRSERDRANTAAEDARNSQVRAEDAERSARNAETAAKDAATEADRQRDEANRQRGNAEVQRTRAEEGERVAVAQLLALLSESGSHDRFAPVFAAEAVARFRSEETDQALRTVTRLGASPLNAPPLRPIAYTRSADGKWLAEAGPDGVVRLIDAATGRLLERWPGLVDLLAFSPDNTRLLGAGKDAILTWDTSLRRATSAIPIDGVTSIAFSSDGGHLGLLQARAITVWDVAAHRAAWTVTLDNENVPGLAVALGGQTVAAGRMTYTTETAPRRRSIPRSELVVYRPAQTGAVVWTCEDCRIQVQTFVDSTRVSIERTDRRPINAKGEPIYQSTVWIDITSGMDERRPAARRGRALGPRVLEPAWWSERLLALSPDRRRAFVGGAGTMGHLCDISAKASCRPLPLAEDARWPAFSRDGQEVLAATSDFVVRRWSVASGAVVREWPVGEAIREVAYAPTGGRLAVLTPGSGSIIVYGDGAEALARIAIDTPETPLARYGQVVAAIAPLALSRNGRHVAAIGRDGMVRLWEIQAGRTALPLPSPGAAGAVAFGTDGSLVLGRPTGAVSVWNLSTHTATEPFRADLPFTDVAMSDDGRFVSASTATSSVVWDVVEERAIARLRIGGRLQFSSDQRVLIIGNAYATIATADLIAHACGMARELPTKDQWAALVGKEERFPPVCK